LIRPRCWSATRAIRRWSTSWQSLFVSTTEASLATLREAIEQGDPSRCRKEAHALKGAAASVLARDIQQLAGEIEACAIDQDMRTAAGKLEQLETRFRDSVA
jgi:HPt (histidine-containing phosphotransfer) domain-containing protein